MATIKNSHVPNMFGDGYEKILTLDDGREFTIKNSCVPNMFGDGYKQEIIENKKETSHKLSRRNKPSDIIWGILGFIVCGIPFIAGVIVTIISLIMPIIAIMGWY